VSAANRRRGNAFECAVAAFLRDHGYRAITSRDAHDGRQFGTDIITDFPVCIEAKNRKQLDLAGWVDQAVEDAHGDLASVWVKRRMRADVGESYVVMRAQDFVALVGRLKTEPLADSDVSF
jgi:Holliday junction resolvase-like predicted endonuclease